MLYLAYHVRRDTLCGDNFCTEGEPSALDEVDQTIVDCFQARIMSRVGPCGDGVASRPRVERDQFLSSTRPEALPELGRASRGQRSEAGPDTHFEKGRGARRAMRWNHSAKRE